MTMMKMILIQVLILILILGQTPMRMVPFLSPLPQVILLVTSMMIPLKLFGLRLCGEWPLSLMGSCVYERLHARQFHSQHLEVAEA